MRDSCDVVIIGAGHNGLTLGSYLARSGLDVVVVERRHEEGGGLCTEELTQAGFLHNVHANYHTFVDLAPPVSDFDVRSHGVEYVRPEVQMASIFDDGTAITVHTDLDKTCASMARFSEEDAETFRRLHTEAHGYVDLLLGTLMYQPPMSVKELTKALASFGVEDRSEFLSVKLRRETINQFLDQHFTNPKVKAHLAFHGAVCSYTSDVPGLAIGFPLLIGKIDNWHLCVGGSHRLAHALWRDLAQHGGVMVSDAEVVGDRGRGRARRRCEAPHGRGDQRAQGGGLHRRRRADVPGVRRSLGTRGRVPGAGGDRGGAQGLDAVLGARRDVGDSLSTLAAEFDPDVNRAWVVNLGYDVAGGPQRRLADHPRGQAPRSPRPNAAVNSLYDPTDAPDGYFTGLLRQFAPFEVNGAGAGEWETIDRWYGQRCLEAWRGFAPNLTEKVVFDWAPFTPLDIARKLVNMIGGDWMMGEISLDNMLDQRPLPELGQYRTPIDGLYMAGSTQHPHGFITFGPAYNALQVIADDLEIDPWWRRV